MQPDIRMVHGWTITLQNEQRDPVLRWRADATQVFAADFASGMDREHALRNLAAKIAVNPEELLSAFQCQSTTA